MLNYNIKKLKKAAMFGIDARVALAIFAIISIVISANIYRIISELNIEKILAESTSIGTAVDQYHKTMNRSIFDTLSDALTADQKETASFLALLENTNIKPPFDTRWNGPYLRSKNATAIEPYLGKSYRLVRLNKSYGTSCADKANPCYVFLKFKDLTADECDAFEDVSDVKKYNKVYRQAASSCNILINVALDY